MNSDEAVSYLTDKLFLDKLYSYAYHRCITAHEAEDLSSDIVLAILRAIHKGSRIDNFYAFAWTVARRTYADYCEKRARQSDSLSSYGTAVWII